MTMTMKMTDYPREALRWLPAITTLDTGRKTMLWQLEIEPRYRADGGFTAALDLNYREVRITIEWLSARNCLLCCQSPPDTSSKILSDGGYRGLLAIDRYVGLIRAIKGVDRSVWWLAVFTHYVEHDGPQLYDATDLMRAASSDDFDRLRSVLALGADVNAADMIGTTALFESAQAGSLRAFQVLLSKGADTTVVTAEDATLLHAAAAGGNAEIISILIDKGLDLNANAFSGRTPLGSAVLNKRTEAAEYLLRAGADPAAERELKLCDEARLRFGPNHPVTMQLCRFSP